MSRQVKRTGGGTFDPSERPIYFAAGHYTTREQRWPPYVLVAVNDLRSAKSEESELLHHLDAGRKVLLDSGVFWLTNEHKRAHGITMDQALALAPEEIDGFEELYDRYVDVAIRYADRLWGYIELDQGGAVNKRRTRTRLEAAGLAPIPVYHPLNDGWDYFDELASSYDRICFGNIVQASRPVRVRLLHALWERHRAYPDLWVHVLGLTANEWCLAVPPDSCDSSSWMEPLRWRHARTESALLCKTGDLGQQFKYDLASPTTESRTQAAGICSDAVTSLNLVWKHAHTRTAELLGQPAHPTHTPNERPAAK